ncbi:MAG: hypothetical protein M3416_13405 [Acidobacteriota bacterium]|nr:hypothetical protein [Acidobacteriota bacterium]
MFTKSAGSAPPSELELVIDSQPDTIALAGPSLHGFVYRSRHRPACYRLLPIDAAPLRRRDEIKNWIGRAMPENVARITNAWHDGSGYFYVRYEVEGLGPSLAEALADQDPCVRLRHAIPALRALPAWWKSLYSPLLPTPWDLVFAGQGQLYLLALPPWGPPDVDSVFAAPARSMYLAPELVRGCDGVSGEGVDSYAFGVALLQCFYSLPPVADAGDFMFRAANDTAFTPSTLTSNLPFWLDALPASAKTLAAASKMVARNVKVREAVDPAELAQLLEYFLRRMDPLVAATDLRHLGRSFEAYTLLQDVLLAQDSYDLLLLAGKLAGEELHRPLEAVDLFERAVAKSPLRAEAYEAQLKLLARAMELAPLRNLIAGNADAAAQIDSKLMRDFQHLPAARQQSSEMEAALARYLVWRGQFDAALKFIYGRLLEGQTYMWWKFDLNLLYARALMGLGRLDDARRQLDLVKGGLFKGREKKTVGEEEIHQHGAVLSELEVRLLKLRGGRGGS